MRRSSACCLVFVNGLFSQELSTLAALPKGVTVGSLAAQFKNNPAGLEPHLGRYLNTQRDRLCCAEHRVD